MKTLGWVLAVALLAGCATRKVSLTVTDGGRSDVGAAERQPTDP